MDDFSDALTAYNDVLAAWIIAREVPPPVNHAEWDARADAARAALLAALGVADDDAGGEE